MSLRKNFGKKSVHGEFSGNFRGVFRPFFVPLYNALQPCFHEKTPKISGCFSGGKFLHFLCFFAFFLHFFCKFVTFSEKKCPKMSRFPPEIPGGYPAAQSGFCKNHVFSGTNFPNFPKLHKFVPGNFRNFREFPGISGISPKSVQKRPFFIDVYKRLQPENKKKPRIFPRDFPGIFREFPGFPENFRNFPGFSKNSGKSENVIVLIINIFYYTKLLC